MNEQDERYLEIKKAPIEKLIEKVLEVKEQLVTSGYDAVYA